MATPTKPNNVNGVDLPYYVPDQSKFPIVASFGLWLMVYGLGSTLNDVKADTSATVSTWTAFIGFFILGKGDNRPRRT